MAAFYATFEYADVHPDGTYGGKLGYFDSIAEASISTVRRTKTLTSFAKSDASLQFAVWDRTGYFAQTRKTNTVILFRTHTFKPKTGANGEAPKTAKTFQCVIETGECHGPREK